MDTTPAPADVHDDGLNWQQRWNRFFTNHPEVVTTHRYLNGGPPSCACSDCDPRGVRPDADIVVVH